METSKLQIKIGGIEFSAEGEKEWVAAQLDKVMANAEKIIALAPPLRSRDGESDKNHEGGNGSDSSGTSKTLATFLKEKNALSSQVEKFLATAQWLHLKGSQRLSTRDVANALSAANQNKLTNPALCLLRNIGKGYCEKDGKQFYVTDEGRDSMK